MTVSGADLKNVNANQKSAMEVLAEMHRKEYPGLKSENISVKQIRADRLEVSPAFRATAERHLQQVRSGEYKPRNDTNERIKNVVLVLNPHELVEKKEFHSSFVDGEFDFDRLTEIEKAYDLTLFEKREKNPYAKLNGQLQAKFKKIGQSTLPAEEKEILYNQARLEQEAYTRELRPKQQALVRQYYAAGNIEALTILRYVNNAPLDMDIAIDSLGQYLLDKVQEGGRLTKEEREAYSFPAACEWSEHEGRATLKSMNEQEEAFKEKLAKHDLLPNEGEELGLQFDKNFRFTVSGVDEEKAKKIASIINEDMKLSSLLVHRLIYPYDDLDDWEIEAYPSELSKEMSSYIKELRKYDNFIEAQVSLLKQHPIELKNVRFVREENGVGVYEGKNKAINAYLKAYPILIQSLDSIRKSTENQKLIFPETQRPQLKFDGEHFDLNF